MGTTGVVRGAAVAKRLSEEEGAGSLADTPREGKAALAKGAEVAKLAKRLGMPLPAGYATFVTRVGEGIYGERVRVFPPERVERELEAWRARVAAHWFWGRKPLSAEEAQEAVRIADTLEGDELVVHPRDPDAILLLPVESERARVLARGLAASLAKLVKKKAPTLRPFAAAPSAPKPAAAPPGGGRSPAGPPGGGRSPAAPPGAGRSPAAPPGGGRSPAAPPGAGRSAASPPPDGDRVARGLIQAAVSSLNVSRLEQLLEANPGVLGRAGARSANLLSLARAAKTDARGKDRLRATLALLQAHGAGKDAPSRPS